MRSLLAVFWTFVLVAGSAWADGPGDNIVDKVRPVPPPGIKVPDDDRARTAGRRRRARQGDRRPQEIAEGKPAARSAARRADLPQRGPLRPDVQRVLQRKNEFDAAKKLLKQGGERAKALQGRQGAVDDRDRPVVRGYVSKIDGSVQPYGLVVPRRTSRTRRTVPARRLVPRPRRDADRSELHQRHGRARRRRVRCRPTPSSCIPTAATATPTIRRRDRPFEAMDARQEALPHRRRTARGARLLDGRGGLLAVRRPLPEPLGRRRAGGRLLRDARLPQRLPEREAVSRPGTRRSSGTSTTAPTTPSTSSTCRRSPTAARTTAEAGRRHDGQGAGRPRGIDLVHIIGPKTGHSTSRRRKTEINRRIDAHRASRPARVAEGDPLHDLHAALQPDALGDARRLDEALGAGRVDAELAARRRRPRRRRTSTASRCRCRPAPARATSRGSRPSSSTTSSCRPTAADVGPARGRRTFARTKNGVDARRVERTTASSKRHGLQGPIDDAFMDSFLMVRPTGKPLNEKVGAWTARR